MKSGQDLKIHNNQLAIKTELKNLSSLREVVKIPKVTPDIFNEGKFKDIERIIWDYSFDYKTPDTQWLKQPFTFFDFSSSEKQILSLVYNAVSLSDVSSQIIATYSSADEKEKASLLDVLVKVREIAIKNLDVDIRTSGGNVIRGVAETITDLGNMLYPDLFQEKLNKTEAVIPVETKEQKQEREEINTIAVNAVFDAIIQNDAKATNAIQVFKDLVMREDNHPLNRIHLLHVAFETFLNRRFELPLKKGTRPLFEALSGERADQFCIKFIGDVIQKDLSPRIRQLLQSNLYHTLDDHKEPFRIDIDAVAYFSTSDQRLGIDYFYGDTELIGRGHPRVAIIGYKSRNTFRDLYHQLYQHPLFVPQKHTTPQVKSSKEQPPALHHTSTSTIEKRLNTDQKHVVNHSPSTAESEKTNRQKVEIKEKQRPPVVPLTTSTFEPTINQHNVVAREEVDEFCSTYLANF